MKQKKWNPAEIRAFRRRLKITQRKLGESMGVTTTYISMLELGAKKPGPMFKLFLDCLERQEAKKERR